MALDKYFINTQNN
uniref:Uncharacterized protein n=1 Tax=Rhizophora mucronata TaxID=61149 RepID=A0A2P2N8K7_RHIMU